MYNVCIQVYKSDTYEPDSTMHRSGLNVHVGKVHNNWKLLSENTVIINQCEGLHTAGHEVILILAVTLIWGIIIIPEEFNSSSESLSTRNSSSLPLELESSNLLTGPAFNSIQNTRLEFDVELYLNTLLKVFVAEIVGLESTLS